MKGTGARALVAFSSSALRDFAQLGIQRSSGFRALRDSALCGFRALCLPSRSHTSMFFSGTRASQPIPTSRASRVVGPITCGSSVEPLEAPAGDEEPQPLLPDNWRELAPLVDAVLAAPRDRRAAVLAELSIGVRCSRSPIRSRAR